MCFGCIYICHVYSCEDEEKNSAKVSYEFTKPKRTLYLDLPDVALGREKRNENFVMSPDSIQRFQLVTEDVARSDALVDEILWPMHDETL
jgi:hypothetical protein